MNTKITYLYRDASNYKQWHETTLSGKVTADEVAQLLLDGLYFIPSLVGLPDLQERFLKDGFAFPVEDDHPWHELVALQQTDAPPDAIVNTYHFLHRLKHCQHSGWERLDCLKAKGVR